MTKVFGLALAGGGARGAYAAGVLRYLYTVLPKELGYPPWPKLVSGTSVGALNGYFAASQSPLEIQRMHELWTNMHVEDVYLVPFRGTFGTVRSLYRSVQRAAVLDPTPLNKLIHQEAGRRTLRHSIARGDCQAFVVSATQLHTGKNVLFVDSNDPTLDIPPPPQGLIHNTKLYPKHLMASAAIPLVFPPVKIGNQLYVDGGLRQNAPLHPLIYSGVHRIMVVGTRTTKGTPAHVNIDPSLGLVAGKTLNALTLDPVERDTLAAERINRMIQWGTQKYGPQFAEELEMETGLKALRILHLRPSYDLGKMAAEVYQPEKIQGSAGLKWLLNKLFEQSKESGESDLLSHLLFDSCYTRTAEDLGFRDAQQHHDELLDFYAT